MANQLSSFKDVKNYIFLKKIILGLWKEKSKYQDCTQVKGKTIEGGTKLSDLAVEVQIIFLIFTGFY